MDRPALDTAAPAAGRQRTHPTLSRVAQFLGWTLAVHTALLLTLLAWYVPMPLLLTAWLAQEGRAVAVPTYSTDDAPDEEAARLARRGIWAGTFTMPAECRKEPRRC